MSDDGRDQTTGRFLTGNVGGPGRKIGSKVKLSEEFLKDMLAAWRTSGKAAIDSMIANKPGDFVKCVASLVPKDINLNDNEFSKLSDDELDDVYAMLRSALDERTQSGSAGKGKAKASNGSGAKPH